MSGSERCPQCGGRLVEGSAEGLCARCLLAVALRHPVTTAPLNLPEPGAWIGQYRIARLLGEGGMGLVYLAEQEAPIARQVAVKIIKLGMDTRAVLARFQSEQQALALMDHPNIAQVYEAGSSDDGRPYFVMEYVPGVPITHFCDGQRLDTRQRLELFLHVAHAVQHAHQKGVIHRDLKPSNVLVMERDGEAVPKIIDFGLAKATEKHLTEETLFTEAGVLIGTPEYMSPEQAALGARNIDPRTDIYSLGVLLYELLVGAVPFDSKELRAAGYDEIRRVIREEDPPTPAARLMSLGAKAAEIAQCRATEAGALRKQVRGELDWITMKALEKECARRYPSASEMAADIEHHLRGEAVTAGPAGVVYRLRKLVRKNRLAVGATVIAASLVAGLLVGTIYYLRAAWMTRGLIRHLFERLDSNPMSYAWESEVVTPRPRALQIGFGAQRTCWTTTTTVRCSEYGGYTSPGVFRFHRVLGLSNNGFLAVTADDEGVSVVEVTSGKPVSTCPDCREGMDTPAIFSPDKSRVAMSGRPGTKVVWDLRSGKKVAIAAWDALAFSPYGRQIALLPRKHADAIELWNVDPLQRIASLAAGGQVNDAAFSPDGARLASVTSKGEVLVWELEPLSGPAVLAAVGKSVEAIAFSPDGRRIAATGSDGPIRIWRDGKLAATLPFSGLSPTIAFSPENQRLAAGTPTGNLFVFWSRR